MGLVLGVLVLVGGLGYSIYAHANLQDVEAKFYQIWLPRSGILGGALYGFLVGYTSGYLILGGL